MWQVVSGEVRSSRDGKEREHVDRLQKNKHQGVLKSTGQERLRCARSQAGGC